MTTKSQLNPLHRTEEVNGQGEVGSLRAFKKERGTVLLHNPPDNFSDFEDRINFDLYATKLANPIKVCNKLVQIVKVTAGAVLVMMWH